MEVAAYTAVKRCSGCQADDACALTRWQHFSTQVPCRYEDF